MSKQNGDCHSTDIQPEQLTAYALGQLRGDELAAVKAAVGEEVNAAAQAEVREVQALAGAISASRSSEPLPKPLMELRAAIERQLDQIAANELVTPAVELPEQRRPWLRFTAVELVVLGSICCLVAALFLPAVQATRQAALRTAGTINRIEQAQSSGVKRQIVDEGFATASSTPSQGYNQVQGPSDTTGDDSVTLMVTPRIIVTEEGDPRKAYYSLEAKPAAQSPPIPGYHVVPPVSESDGPQAGGFQYSVQTAPQPTAGAGDAGIGYGGGGPMPVGGRRSVQTSPAPFFLQSPGASGASRGGGGPMPGGGQNPEASVGAGGYGGYIPVPAGGGAPGSGESVRGFYDRADSSGRQSEREVAVGNTWEYRGFARQKGSQFSLGDRVGNERYEQIIENQFLAPTANPLSTFSIDVDTASYANVRRFLTGGSLPPPSAVRIEELVNYFTYSYPQPTGKEPFSVNMEAAECPWNAGHLLLRVGLKGKEIHRSERPPSNLTFLLDVSGSMADANKLPLVKTTLMMFVAELTENDRVSIVTYAGDAGLRLPPTLGHEKDKIMAAIDSLSAGGSTHGSAGIQLAYEQAGQYFLKEGTNRVILATDGDLNVGVTSDDALVQLIKEKATGGTFLTVLGFGTGNLKDGKLEKLADNGNGVYAYIDGVREGRKVLVEQMSGSLVTIAKDVKIQIEFNPAQIASYRLLGYENRVLAAEDFNNDKKDAGEIGAGHTVTALYELVPVGTKEQAVAAPTTEPLKYQATGTGGQEPGGQRSEVGGQQAGKLTDAAASGELLTLKLRYKEPDGVESRLVEFPLKDRGGKFNGASKDLQFAAAVASLGMILRGSEHRGTGNLPAVAEIASGAIGNDPNGYRAEFVDLVRKAQSLGAK